MKYIGIDLGGTNIKAGIVDDDGTILFKDSIKTDAHRPQDEIIRDMGKLCVDICEKAGIPHEEIESIGVGSPGSCDAENGVLVYANNINFSMAPIRAGIQKVIDKPVYLSNDANCAAVGEYMMNEEKTQNFVAITLGTGIGGGVIVNGKLYIGMNGAGAELGHITLVKDGEPCTCGRNGCWEAYGSVTALIRITKEAIEKNPTSRLAEIAEEHGKVSGRTAFLAAREGDKVGQAMVDEWIENVADGVTSIVNVFQPEVLVIGGAICKEGDFLLNPIIKYVEKYRYSRPPLAQTVVKIAKLGNDAGLIGAAFLGKV